MNESFLHYVWQYQYFDKKELQTSEQENVSVIKTGHYNKDAGPDFLNARVHVGNMEWSGHVEIHFKSSDWLTHQHQHDRAYDNVILHVVWDHDKEITRTDGTKIPTLQLKDKVNTELVKGYKKLINSGHSIPCQDSWSKVSDIIQYSAIEQSLMQRLEAKSLQVTALLQQNLGDWEETTYQLLAKNFGFKINSESFLQLAKSTPYKILRKHAGHLTQVEALLFGQAGMLISSGIDEYHRTLFKEYQFLNHKYSLGDTPLHSSQWKFLRLRPSNFPTLRLAQFAALVSSTHALFSRLIETKQYKEVKALFDLHPSDYWKTHYRFGKKAGKNVPSLGESAIENILINSVVPLLVAYGKATDEQLYIDRALEILQHLPSEENKIIRSWKDVGCDSKTAFESQGLIELYNSFCSKRNCLQCAVGASLLNPGKGDLR